MSNLNEKAKVQLKDCLLNALNKSIEKGLLPEGEISEFIVEIPNDRQNGDYSSNIALAGARTFKCAPRKIADAILENIELDGTYFTDASVAGAGFLNFNLSDKFFADVVADVLTEKENYGRATIGKGQKIMVEFVSANPTGPMHIGNARGGALGDCLASVLDFAGYDTYREFYVNDAGNQIIRFGLSLEARYLQIFKGEENVEFPEDGYHGDDIKERAKEFADIYGDKYVDATEDERRDALTKYALEKNIDALHVDLERYRIVYDTWFLESTMHGKGKGIEKAIGILSDNGLTYEKDGALWYKATQFGAEKDEVLIRQNGTPTYFAADIAYHYNKFAIRKFDRVINVWGADHHGHVARLKDAITALGLDGNKLDIVLMQLVRLVKDGEAIKVSKRTGKAITLNNLLDEVPLDAARFFFNMREPNTHLEFDMDLAVKESSDNPVYYVQYAHARICSILRKLQEEGIDVNTVSADDLKLLTMSEEKELIRYISLLTDTVIESANTMDPSKITKYAIELATLFHKFYNACRVNCDDESLRNARIALVKSVKIIIANLLGILKVTCPDKM
jgi:arginyl-tRNA synthetase